MVIAGGNKKKRPLKGQVAKITKIVGKSGDRVILEGLNAFVRHTKAKSASEASGKLPVQLSVHISNVMYYSENAKRPVRLSRKLRDDGMRIRGYRDPVSKEFVEV
jgi:large subunit ribosomal protein L24